MGDITRTMPTPKGAYVDIKWPGTVTETLPLDEYIKDMTTALRACGDALLRLTVTWPTGETQQPEAPANRHERRQEASRKHQRATLHGAGDQKRIAVERRGE